MLFDDTNKKLSTTNYKTHTCLLNQPQTDKNYTFYKGKLNGDMENIPQPRITDNIYYCIETLQELDYTTDNVNTFIANQNKKYDQTWIFYNNAPQRKTNEPYINLYHHTANSNENIEMSMWKIFINVKETYIISVVNRILKLIPLLHLKIVDPSKAGRSRNTKYCYEPRIVIYFYDINEFITVADKISQMFIDIEYDKIKCIPPEGGIKDAIIDNERFELSIKQPSFTKKKMI